MVYEATSESDHRTTCAEEDLRQEQGLSARLALCRLSEVADDRAQERQLAEDLG